MRVRKSGRLREKKERVCMSEREGRERRKRGCMSEKNVRHIPVSLGVQLVCFSP